MQKIKILNNYYEILFNLLPIKPVVIKPGKFANDDKLIRSKLVFNGIMFNVYHDYNQAELSKAASLSLDDKLFLHKKLIEGWKIV